MSCIYYTTKIKFSYFTVLLLTVIIYQYLNIDIVLAAIEYKTNVKQRILPYLNITFKTRHLNCNTSNLAFCIPITQADNSLLKCNTVGARHIHIIIYILNKLYLVILISCALGELVIII